MYSRFRYVLLLLLLLRSTARGDQFLNAEGHIECHDEGHEEEGDIAGEEQEALLRGHR